MSASPSLSRIARALHNQHSLGIFDCGPEWTVVAWSASDEALSLTEDWVAKARARLRASPPAPLPFAGGLVGWIGYEAGRTVERMPLPRTPPAVPELLLWRSEGALCLHHPTKRWHPAGSPTFQAEARKVLATAPPHAERPAAPAPWQPRASEHAARYQSGVASVLDAIRAGDVYQVSLAWEQSDLPITDPLGCWLALREANPAERGAYLRFADVEVLSNSPEVYLLVAPDGTVQSMPIKGTARCSDGDQGRLRLWRSEKERAELTMIVDLVRNDLGRIAATGSVRAGPRRLRRCGDLLHAEQVISARLRAGADALDAVTASFPPGSVTGAPKVSAMSLIHALESGPRGIYTGSIGFFGDDGSAHLNVAIRTATVRNGLARFHVGAGIVADSDPQQEWDETVAKGRALAGWLAAT